MRRTIGISGRIFTILLILSECTIFGQIDPALYPAMVEYEIKKTDNDSLKIERLFDLAFFYFDYNADDPHADSVSKVALGLAEMNHRPELLLLAYNRYIESNDIHKNYQKALDYAIKSEQISVNLNNPEISFRTDKNIVSVYLAAYEYDKALKYSYKLLSIAGTAENNLWKASAYLAIGKCLEGKNQKIEAFRNYLNATDLAERIKNRDLQMKCYAQLSDFYNLNKVYHKSVHYKLMQSDLMKQTKPVDSVALIWTQFDLQVIDLNSNNNRLNEGNMRVILDFAKRRRHNRLLKYEIALIRTHLIEADKIDLLHDLYYKQFPAELDRLASVNPGLFNRLKAFFCEKENMPDSAIYYFNKAEMNLQSEPNKILQSTFYERFGQFLVRHGLKAKAIEKFSKSYDLAKTASNFDYMLSASRQLESLYAGNRDYKNAYSYAGLNKVLADSINSMSKQDQILLLEIDHESRQRDLAAELEKQSTSRRHYLQYTAIIIIIIGVFIVLLMLGSLKVPGWIIKMLGFFSFIFLFEFIVLIADHKIQVITQGEPWKILLIKIFLIAILLPIHEWIEKKVLSFLLDPGLINISRYPFRSTLRKHIGRFNRK